ncbi:MAG: hypothetical protein ACP5M4_09970 [Acidobacteriaceae bacterium]
MWFMHMHDLLTDMSQWGVLVPALLVTVGVGLLVGCCMGCMCSPKKEKDDLFRHEA